MLHPYIVTHVRKWKSLQNVIQMCQWRTAIKKGFKCLHFLGGRSSIAKDTNRQLNPKHYLRYMCCRITSQIHNQSTVFTWWNIKGWEHTVVGCEGLEDVSVVKSRRLRGDLKSEMLAGLLGSSEAWRHSSWGMSQRGNKMLRCIECIVSLKGEYWWIVLFEYVTFML